MQVSGKMAKTMAKVQKRGSLYVFLIGTFFGNAKGKLFSNNQIRYEGEWKDNEKCG